MGFTRYSSFYHIQDPQAYDLALQYAQSHGLTRTDLEAFRSYLASENVFLKPTGIYLPTEGEDTTLNSLGQYELLAYDGTFKRFGDKSSFTKVLTPEKKEPVPLRYSTAALNQPKKIPTPTAKPAALPPVAKRPPLNAPSKPLAERYEEGIEFFTPLAFVADRFEKGITFMEKGVNRVSNSFLTGLKHYVVGTAAFASFEDDKLTHSPSGQKARSAGLAVGSTGVRAKLEFPRALESQGPLRASWRNWLPQKLDFRIGQFLGLGQSIDFKSIKDSALYILLRLSPNERIKIGRSWTTFKLTDFTRAALGLGSAEEVKIPTRDFIEGTKLAIRDSVEAGAAYINHLHPELPNKMLQKALEAIRSGVWGFIAQISSYLGISELVDWIGKEMGVKVPESVKSLTALTAAMAGVHYYRNRTLKGFGESIQGAIPSIIIWELMGVVYDKLEDLGFPRSTLLRLLTQIGGSLLIEKKAFPAARYVTRHVVEALKKGPPPPPAGPDGLSSEGISAPPPLRLANNQIEFVYRGELCSVPFKSPFELPSLYQDITGAFRLINNTLKVTGQSLSFTQGLTQYRKNKQFVKMRTEYFHDREYWAQNEVMPRTPLLILPLPALGLGLGTAKEALSTGAAMLTDVGAPLLAPAL